MAGRKALTFREWLSSNETLIVAEGYLMEFERRGYLRAGDFVPEVVLEHPHLVKVLHEEFVHAGSDVTLAFTYYTHRKKMATVGMADLVEHINKTALKIAKEVAEKTGTIFASGVCNTNILPGDKDAEEEIRAIFTEQIDWAKESGVEYIVAESLSTLQEAKIALEVVKQRGLPIVITFNIYKPSGETLDGYRIVEACKIMEDLGADVVGVNCGRGPETIMPILRELRQTCKGRLAALPVCYRTTEKEPCWFQLTDPTTGEEMYPKNLSAVQSCPADIEKFGKQCQELGISYVGLCCGNFSSLTRELAMTFGRSPSACGYTYNANRSLKDLWLKSEDSNNKSSGSNTT